MVGSKFEQEQQAGVGRRAVPRDRLLRGRFRFDMPSRGDVVGMCVASHQASGIFYAGDGSYDSPGEYPTTLRHSSNRAIGYISAFRAMAEPVYRARGLEALDYVLSLFDARRGFPWYHRSYRGIYNRNDGLFEAGIAGRGFVEAYRLTGDRRWLEASEAVARWEMDCPVSDNNNYNLFAVWHLAGHFEVTGDRDALQSAIEKTRLGGLPGQLPGGGWPGHNSWIWYHGIMVRGMAELARVLPADSSFRPELMAALTAAVNRAISEQRKSGEVPPNPGLRRPNHASSFIAHGLLAARHTLGAGVDNCIWGILRKRLQCSPDPEFIEGLASAWADYRAARASATAAATGETVWQADLTAFESDPVWGEKPNGAFGCWYPMNDLDAEFHHWMRASDNDGRPVQAIVSRGARLFGGIGWQVPVGRLVTGRRYRFTASVSCEGTPATVPAVLCSAYAGTDRPEHDPFTDCEFTRENPTFRDFDEVSVHFTASAATNRVFVWMMSSELRGGEQVALAVRDARIVDAGRPLPRWHQRKWEFDSEMDTILLPPGVYLDSIRQD